MTSASREQNSSAGAPETEQLKMEHRVTAQSPPSDNDSGERPVRQQLKETNLDSVGENNGPARPNRKRSLDNTDGATDNPPTKRSRECTPDNLKASTEDKSNHAGIPKDATTQNVSNNVPATTPANTIPETKVQFPLVLELKVSIGGSEQITHMTIPVEIDIKLPGRLFSLTSSTARSAEGESSKTHVTGPSANPILPSGSPSPGHPSPPHNSPVHPSSGQAVSEYYAHEDPSFYIYEDPESIGDHSSEDSLPDYCSPGFLSSPPPPLSSTHPDYPIPTVEITGSNHSQYPQNLETTAGGNEDDSSQILKKKRSREQLEDDVSQNSHAATDSALGLDEATSSDEKRTTEGQPEKKRPRDNSEERKAKVDQTFTASAFGQSANAPSPFAIPATKSTSDASPFATTGASTTGFGALGSGFSAFGSPFSAPSGKLTSFASPNAPAAFSGTTGKLTSFASANAPASFSGTAGKLTSFASPNAPVSFGESNDKTLGAKQSDNEESDNEAAGEPDGTFVAEKTDERFHEQTVETGEENETTKFSAKGKLYYFDDKKWKERGIGTFKVNLKTESNGKKSGRMIMRADGALRVMLNSAIWHSMPFGDTKSARPATRDIYLASKEDEKVVSLLLRLGGEKSAQELYDVLKDTLEKI